MAEEKTVTVQYVKVDVIAQLFGVSVRRIQQLTQEGVIKTSTADGHKREYELVPTIRTYIQYLSDKAYGREISDKEAELKNQKLQADIALKESQGELHRLKTAIACGEYLSLAEVKVDYERFFLTFKKMALSLPSRLAGRVSNQLDPVEVRAIEKDIQDEISKTLTQFVLKAVVDGPEKDNS